MSVTIPEIIETVSILTSISKNLQGNYSLHISELSEATTEEDLVSIFKDYNVQLSVICRDSDTQSSLGSGYLLISTLEDAMRCLHESNFIMINGKMCRLAWALDKSIRSQLYELIVSNLPKGTNHKDLYEWATTYGEIISCKVFDGESSGNLIIYDLNVVDNFLNNESNLLLNESCLSVKLKENSLNNNRKLTNSLNNSGDNNETDNSNSNPNQISLTNNNSEVPTYGVFINGFNNEYTKVDLEYLIVERTGVQPSSVFIRKGKDNNHYSFVNFQEEEESVSVVNVLNDLIVDNHKLYARLQKKIPASPMLNNKEVDMSPVSHDKEYKMIYARGFPKSMSKLDCRNHFYVKNNENEIVYTPKTHTMIRTPEGEFTGVCYAGYETTEEVEAIKELLDGAVINYGPNNSYSTTLYVKQLQKKNERYLNAPTIRNVISGSAKQGSKQGDKTLITMKLSSPHINDSERRHLIGNYLYPFAKEQTNNILASKITGMILEQPFEELVNILQSDHAVNTLIQEALKTLYQSNLEMFPPATLKQYITHIETNSNVY